MAEERRLPIKVVIPVPRDFQKPPPGGGKRKEFGKVNKEFRRQLVGQLESVRREYLTVSKEDARIPRVARVVLKQEAIAKTHRPVNLFSQDTCPIIGGQDLGKVLISVRPQGLDHLLNKISQDDTVVGKADISTIERIEPYTADDAFRISVEGQSELKKEGKLDLKYRLFRHLRPDLDESISIGFKTLLKRLSLDADQLNYGTEEMIFRVKNVPQSAIQNLAGFVGAQSVSDFPYYQTVRAEAIPLREAKPSDFPIPETHRSYPIVGIIDSGVNPLDPLLHNWIVAREESIPEEYRNYNHGSFVAALIINGRGLNQNDLRFPEASAKIVDVVALPGRGDSIREDQLLTILDEVIPKHPDVKVWNLSLSKEGAYCKNDVFSDFATALDRIQDTYGVRFVIAAGNYGKPPFRGWPPEDLDQFDRISPPADSVRGITVGSIAHVDRPNSRVKAGEPSPFSRRGPGACFIPKPEVAHYGGNCDAQGRFSQTGILSFDGNRKLVENIGTSFSTPLVSALLANIYDSLGHDASHVLAKALLIHSAVLQSKPISAEQLNYTGFGIPNDLLSTLTCDLNTATLIFEPGHVRPGLDFIKGNFPIPNCLRTPDGRMQGEIIVTMVYDPPLDAAFGAEYCRRNCEVSLGTYNPNNPKAEHQKKIPCEPQDVSELYEAARVEHGFKWSPVKVYRREFPRGVTGEHWRIVVKAHDRSGVSDSRPTPIAIVVSIRDPERQQPVYDEVVALMNRGGWTTQDLRVSERIKVRTRI